MKEIFGSLTLVFAVIMIFIGLTSQIYKNYLEKKSGMSFLMILLPLFVYFFRGGYSITIRSWYILIPDTFGLIFSVILLIQYFMYKNTEKK